MLIDHYHGLAQAALKRAAEHRATHEKWAVVAHWRSPPYAWSIGSICHGLEHAALVLAVRHNSRVRLLAGKPRMLPHGYD